MLGEPFLCRYKTHSAEIIVWNKISCPSLNIHSDKKTSVRTLKEHKMDLSFSDLRQTTSYGRKTCRIHTQQ